MPDKVFVSSTFDDLKRHRERAIRALRRSGFFVDPMEDWTASADEPKDFSTDRLDGCSLCVALIGLRRGYIPDGASRSITQMEIAEAEKRGVDVLVFMLDEDAPWPHKFVEIDTDPEVRRWRDRLATRYGVEWFGYEPESLDIGPALQRWVRERRTAPAAVDGAECVAAQPPLEALRRRLDGEPAADVLSALRAMIIAWLEAVAAGTGVDPSGPPRNVLVALHGGGHVDDAVFEPLDIAITTTSEALYDVAVAADEVSNAIEQAAIAFNAHLARGTDSPHFSVSTDKRGRHYFRFDVGGGALLTSNPYNSSAATINGIRSARRIAASRPIEPAQARNGAWFFSLVAPNGEVVATSVMFPDRADADAAIETVRCEMPEAPVLIR